MLFEPQIFLWPELFYRSAISDGKFRRTGEMMHWFTHWFRSKEGTGKETSEHLIAERECEQLFHQLVWLYLNVVRATSQNI